MKLATRDTFTTVAPEIERDRLGRPMVVPPGGGNPVPYTRCTTYVGGIEDTWNLSRWTQRMVILGMAGRDDLRAAVLDTDREDKKRLDELCEEAKEAGGGNDAARIGTYMHQVTEAADTGQDPDAVPFPLLAFARDPAEFKGDLDAYMKGTEHLQAVAVEQFSVQDPLKIGGTPDRVVRYGGKHYIADLKTGNIEYGTLKIAAQLAVYARSTPYDVAKAERTTRPYDVDLERGIIIHLPAGTGTCRLYWIDLLAGWESVRVCRSIREQRTRRFGTLTEPFPMTEPVPSVPVEDGESFVPEPVIELAGRIKRCSNPHQVRALWGKYPADAWTKDLIDLAKTHIASLTR